MFDSIFFIFFVLLSHSGVIVCVVVGVVFGISPTSVPIIGGTLVTIVVHTHSILPF